MPPLRPMFSFVLQFGKELLSICRMRPINITVKICADMLRTNHIVMLTWPPNNSQHVFTTKQVCLSVWQLHFRWLTTRSKIIFSDKYHVIMFAFAVLGLIFQRFVLQSELLSSKAGHGGWKAIPGVVLVSSMTTTTQFAIDAAYAYFQWRRRNCVGPGHSTATPANVAALEFSEIHHTNP